MDKSEMTETRIDMTPTRQSFDVHEATGPDGTKVAVVYVYQPLSTFAIVLNEEGALKMADRLREVFGGIRIVNDSTAWDQLRGVPPIGRNGRTDG